MDVQLVDRYSGFLLLIFNFQFSIFNSMFIPIQIKNAVAILKIIIN